MTSKLIIVATALSLGFGAIGAQAAPTKKKKPSPSIQIENKNNTTLFGIPINKHSESYKAGKNGIQVKQSKGDFFGTGSTTYGVNKDGQIKIKNENHSIFPW